MGPRLLAILMFTCAACVAHAQDTSGNSRSLAFTAGGTIEITLRVGDVEIVGSSDEKIAVSWKPVSRSDEIEVKLSRDGDRDASLYVNGPNDKVRYRIEVPSRSDLVIDMNAGALQVSGVSGSLKASLRAGDLTARPRDRGPTHGSLTKPA